MPVPIPAPPVLPTALPAASPNGSAARLFALASGAFAAGTSAFAVSGVLPAISAELAVSPAAAGQLATAFALAYAVGAPVLAGLSGRWGRRALLLAALALSAAGNALSALAPDYPLLVVGRVLAALGAAAYTPAATLTATQLLPPERRARAVAVVLGGLTAALAVGVPAGALLEPAVGYRGVFWLVTAACLGAGGLVALGVPALAPAPAVPLRTRIAVAADRRVLTCLTMTVLTGLATISVYTYVRPLLAATAGLDATAVGLLLLAYGLGAIVGNAVGGRAADRFGSTRTLAVVLAVLAVLTATLPLTTTTALGAGLTLFTWSLATWAFNPPLQSLLLGTTTAGGLVLALNAAAVYLGIALAGAVGGLVVSTAGVLALPPIGGAIALVVLALLAVVRTGASRTGTSGAGPRG